MVLAFLLAAFAQGPESRDALPGWRESSRQASFWFERRQPGQHGGAAGHLSRGERVWVTRCLEDWCEFQRGSSRPDANSHDRFMLWVAAADLSNPLSLDSLRANEAALDAARDSMAAVRAALLKVQRDSMARLAQVIRDSLAREAHFDSLADAAQLTRDSLAFTRRAAVEGAGKWTRTNSRSPMDDSPTVILQLRSENVATGWLASNRTTLVIRCKERRTEVYVVTGMAANPELGAYHEASVRTRLDGARPQNETWSEATSNDALFSSGGIPFAIQLVHARRFRLEFTPFNAGPVIVEFDLRGLAHDLPAVANACGWSNDMRRRMFEEESNR
jgi:type VI secretion system protein VasI